MCGPNGGGGGNNPDPILQKQQEQAKSDIAAINKVYNNPARQQQYADYRANVANLLQGNLNQQKEQGARQLKFALARSGISGGSQDVYQHNLFNKDLTNATVALQRRADNALASLQTNDQQQRQQLIALAQSGALSGSANDLASQAMQTALSNAKGNQVATDFSSFMGNLAPIYAASQRADAMRRLYQQALTQQLYGSSANPYGATGW